MVKEKLKPLLPSLREKKRYLAFEVISKEKLGSASAVNDAILRSAGSFMGELGMSKAGLKILGDKWNSALQRGIIKTSHLHVDDLRAALALIGAIENQQVIVRSVGVSGILKKAQERYLAG